MRVFAIRAYGGPDVLEEMGLPLAAVGPPDVRWRVHLWGAEFVAHAHEMAHRSWTDEVGARR